MGTLQEMIALTWPENVAKVSDNNMLSVLPLAPPDLVRSARVLPSATLSIKLCPHDCQPTVQANCCLLPLHPDDVPLVHDFQSIGPTSRARFNPFVLGSSLSS